MLRCTIEIVPRGNEEKKRIVGIVEIANDASGSRLQGNYKVILRKIPPWKFSLKRQWKMAYSGDLADDEAVLQGEVEGFDRIRRGPYDLLYRALRSCGFDKRNP